MGGKKILFLFLGLGMPILVFLFLKMFGRNEFEVPMPEIKPPADCHVTNIESYSMSDSVINTFTKQPFSILILNFGSASKKLDRVAESFSPEVVKVEEANMQGTAELIGYFRKCRLFLQSPNTLVILDKQRRIRGYYDGTDRDELDRLEAEVKIILKRY